MSPQRPAVIVASVLIAFSRFCDASQIVVVVANDSIVVASDSKQRMGSLEGMAEDKDPVNKVVILNNRVAIAVVGLGVMRISLANVPDFFFSAIPFLNGIRDSLPPDASASLIEGIVVKELKNSMNGLSPYIANGMFNRQNAPIGEIIELILVGYENGVPTVRKIHIDVDWNDRKIVSPVVDTVYPPPYGSVNSYVVFFGRNAAIQRAANPATSEGKAAIQRYPGVSKGLSVDIHNESINGIDGTDLPPFSHPFITGVFSFRLMVVVGEGRGAMAPLPSRSVRNSLGVR